MSTTFENIQIGDKVWCMAEGWGVVDDIEEYSDYPLRVSFPNGSYRMYTLDGLDSAYANDRKVQSLFWDEIVNEAPEKPIPELAVDTKVIVWDSDMFRCKRYFSHFNSSGEIECFVHGKTSWTTEDTVDWPYWELAK